METLEAARYTVEFSTLEAIRNHLKGRYPLFQRVIDLDAGVIVAMQQLDDLEREFIFAKLQCDITVHADDLTVFGHLDLIYLHS